MIAPMDIPGLIYWSTRVAFHLQFLKFMGLGQTEQLIAFTISAILFLLDKWTN